MVNELGGFKNGDPEELDYAFSRRLIFPGRELPGQTWESGNMFTAHGFVPNCNMDKGIYDDPVWRDGTPGRLHVNAPGRGLLSQLFYSDPSRRLQAVEQLTLPPQYSTVPNTGAFSRFEHIWGLALFVEQMCRKNKLSEHETTIRMAKAALHDFATRAKSHMADWMLQSVTGPQDQHDLDLPEYLEYTGVNDIIHKNGFEPEEILSSKEADWSEAPQPHICGDRADFYTREAKRTNQTFQLEWYTSDDFIITPDNMLAMKDVQRARMYAECALFCAQENWSEATHRAVLDLFMIRSKLFYAQGGAPREWVLPPGNEVELVALEEVHPRDLMYFTDPVELQSFAYPSLAGNTIEAIMLAVSQYHRQYVWPGRNRRINLYLDQFRKEQYKNVFKSGKFTHYTDKSLDTFRDEYPSTLPIGLAIVDGVPEPREDCIDIPQPPFKKRQIDPLVKNGKHFEHLSEIDPSYGERLEEHALALSAMKTARFSLPDKKAAAILRENVENVESEWQRRLETSRRLTPAEMRELVRVSASRIHGNYPFMTFLDY
jgi:hypothetical protein